MLKDYQPEIKGIKNGVCLTRTAISWKTLPNLKYEAILNGKPYEMNSSIEDNDRYLFILTVSNDVDYEIYKINFTIDNVAPPKPLCNVEDGQTYDKITLELSNLPDNCSAKATINGTPFSTGSTFMYEGENHYLIITYNKNNGLSSESRIKFNIKHTIPNKPSILGGEHEFCNEMALNTDYYSKFKSYAKITNKDTGKIDDYKLSDIIKEEGNYKVQIYNEDLLTNATSTSDIKEFTIDRSNPDKIYIANLKNGERRKTSFKDIFYYTIEKGYTGEINEEYKLKRKFIKPEHCEVKALLDNVEYNWGTEVKEIGKHTLDITVTKLNGSVIKYKYTFFIEENIIPDFPHIRGIKDGKCYFHGCRAYLDNISNDVKVRMTLINQAKEKLYTSYFIQEEGDYTLNVDFIVGDSIYKTEELHFSIDRKLAKPVKLLNIPKVSFLENNGLKDDFKRLSNNDIPIIIEKNEGETYSIKCTGYDYDGKIIVPEFNLDTNMDLLKKKENKFIKYIINCRSERKNGTYYENSYCFCISNNEVIPDLVFTNKNKDNQYIVGFEPLFAINYDFAKIKVSKLEVNKQSIDIKDSKLNINVHEGTEYKYEISVSELVHQYISEDYFRNNDLTSLEIIPIKLTFTIGNYFSEKEQSFEFEIINKELKEPYLSKNYLSPTFNPVHVYPVGFPSLKGFNKFVSINKGDWKEVNENVIIYDETAEVKMKAVRPEQTIEKKPVNFVQEAYVYIRFSSENQEYFTSKLSSEKPDNTVKDEPIFYFNRMKPPFLNSLFDSDYLEEIEWIEPTGWKDETFNLRDTGELIESKKYPGYYESPFFIDGLPSKYIKFDRFIDNADFTKFVKESRGNHFLDKPSELKSSLNPSGEKEFHRWARYKIIRFVDTIGDNIINDIYAKFRDIKGWQPITNTKNEVKIKALDITEKRKGVEVIAIDSDKYLKDDWVGISADGEKNKINLTKDTYYKIDFIAGSKCSFSPVFDKVFFENSDGVKQEISVEKVKNKVLEEEMGITPNLYTGNFKLNKNVTNGKLIIGTSIKNFSVISNTELEFYVRDIDIKQHATTLEKTIPEKVIETKPIIVNRMIINKEVAKIEKFLPETDLSSDKSLFTISDFNFKNKDTNYHITPEIIKDNANLENFAFGETFHKGIYTINSSVYVGHLDNLYVHENSLKNDSKVLFVREEILRKPLFKLFDSYVKKNILYSNLTESCELTSEEVKEIESMIIKINDEEINVENRDIVKITDILNQEINKKMKNPLYNNHFEVKLYFLGKNHLLFQPDEFIFYNIGKKDNIKPIGDFSNKIVNTLDFELRGILVNYATVKISNNVEESNINYNYELKPILKTKFYFNSILNEKGNYDLLFKIYSNPSKYIEGYNSENVLLYEKSYKSVIESNSLPSIPTFNIEDRKTYPYVSIKADKGDFTTKIKINGNDYVEGVTLKDDNVYKLEAYNENEIGKSNTRFIIFKIDSTPPRPPIFINMVEGNSYPFITPCIQTDIFPFEIVESTLNGKPYQFNRPRKTESNPPNFLSEGFSSIENSDNYTLKVTIQNPDNGLTASNSINFKVEKIIVTPPIIKGVSNGDVIGSCSPTWEIDDTFIYTAILDGNSYNMGSLIYGEGSHTLTVTKISILTNQEASSTVHFTIDNTPPNAPIVHGLENGDANGWITPENGNKYTVLVNGKEISTTNKYGNIHFKVDNDGSSYYVTVIATKESNGMSNSTGVVFEGDPSHGEDVSGSSSTITTDPPAGKLCDRVRVSINYGGATRLIKLVKVGDEDWMEYGGAFYVFDNITIQSKTMDYKGNESDVSIKKINNIDKSFPVASTFVNITDGQIVPSYKVIVTPIDSLCTNSIYLNGKQIAEGDIIDRNGDYELMVITTRSTNLKQAKNTVKFKIRNKYRGFTPVVLHALEEQSIDKVTVTIVYPSNSPISERYYRIDRGNWTNYVGSFEVANNCFIEAKCKDDYGFPSPIGDSRVTNIDLLPPEPPLIKGIDGDKIQLVAYPYIQKKRGIIYTATLDGKPYIIGTPIFNNREKIEKHQLIVTATKISNKKFAISKENFIIDSVEPSIPQLTDIKEDMVLDVVSPKIIRPEKNVVYSALLDGKPYTFGTPIETKGSHVLLVSARKTTNNLSVSKAFSFYVLKDKDFTNDDKILPNRFSLEPLLKRFSYCMVDGELLIENGHIYLFKNNKLISKTEELEKMLKFVGDFNLKRKQDYELHEWMLESIDFRLDWLVPRMEELEKINAELKVAFDKLRGEVNTILAIVNNNKSTIDGFEDFLHYLNAQLDINSSKAEIITNKMNPLRAMGIKILEDRQRFSRKLAELLRRERIIREKIPKKVTLIRFNKFKETEMTKYRSAYAAYMAALAAAKAAEQKGV